MTLKSRPYSLAGLAGLVAIALAPTCLGTPPPNDNCGNATVIPGIEGWQIINLSEATTQPCEATSSCDGVSSQSVWYRMTAPGPGQIWAHISGDDSNPQLFALSVFDGCAIPVFGGCVQPLEIACEQTWFWGGNPITSVNADVQGGHSYLIKVALLSGNGAQDTLNVSFHPLAPNENCGNATVIPPAGMSQIFDPELANEVPCEEFLPSCSPVQYVTNVVWYKYQAVANGTLTVHTDGTPYTTHVTAHNGCPLDIPQIGCVAPTELACATGDAFVGAEMSLSVSAGQSYILRIFGIGNPGDLLHFACEFKPANDHCGQAALIIANTYNPPVMPVGYADASSLEPQENCHTAVLGVAKSVFYKFIPTTDGTASLDTIGSNYDTVLSVHDGCGMLVLPNGWIQPALLACHNDIGGLLGAASQISGLPMQAGHTYLIKVAANNSGDSDDMLDFNFQFTPTASCIADIAPAGGDGSVNTSDLLAVINNWGACANPLVCPPDIAPPPNGDNAVNTSDLLAVINSWGPCP